MHKQELRFIVCLEYKTESGETKVIRSKPKRWKKARKLRDRYKDMAHRAWLERVEPVDLLNWKEGLARKACEHRN